MDRINKVGIYVYRDRISSEGIVSLYVSTTVKGSPVRIPVGIRCHVDNIDFEKNVIGASEPFHEDKNLIISATIARLTDIFVRYRLQWRQLSKEQLLKEYGLQSATKDFHTYAHYKLEERKLQIEAGTYRRHASQLNKIREYAPNLCLSDINEAWVNGYIAWCRKVQKNKPNSVRSSISVLKFYVGQALEDKLMGEDPFRKIRVSGSDTDREFLTEDELRRVFEIYKGSILPDSHKKAMRNFLFSCCCGLRMGDVKRLKEEHILGENIVMLAGKTQNSSGAMVNIPITPVMRSLMGEYSPGKPIFELFSEFRMNVMIQEVMELAKVKKHITFYCARHTFATIFLKNTGNIVMLKNLLGHKKIEQTLVYAHLIRDDVTYKMMDTFSDFSV